MGLETFLVVEVDGGRDGRREEVREGHGSSELGFDEVPSRHLRERPAQSEGGGGGDEHDAHRELGPKLEPRASRLKCGGLGHDAHPTTPHQDCAHARFSL
jgi:hypothetical protein